MLRLGVSRIRNEKKQFYLSILGACMSFVFGSILIQRANKDFEDLTHFEGRIEALGTTKSSRSKDMLFFKINGLEQTLGIFHNSVEDYQIYLAKIQKGDSIDVWYDKTGKTTEEDINLHVYQLKKGQEILLTIEQVNKKDKDLAIMCYGGSLLFGLMALWFYQKKIEERKLKDQRPTLNPPATML